MHALRSHFNLTDCSEDPEDHAMSTLRRAIEIAEAAHAGKKDKGESPYIGHPRRVMNAVDMEEEKIVAILHDVVET